VGGDATDSDADIVTGIAACTTLVSGEIDLTWDAGFFLPAAIGDFVWHDLDADGIQDAGEPGIAGVEVKLFDCVTILQVGVSQFTDGDGLYLFSGLMPGTYHVEFAPVPGFVRSPQDQGGDATDSDADIVTGIAACTTLVSGETDLTWDAGFYTTAPDIDIEKYIKIVQEPGGGEGLTPGFWKTHSEYGPAPLAGWPDTGYGPDDNYQAVFGVDVPGTLLQALQTGGGGLDALLRHSTAALLNAAHPNIEYGLTAAQVISMTQTAINSGDAGQIEALKDQFASLNEQGADLSNGGGGGGGGGGGIGEDADTPPTGPIVFEGNTVMFTYVVTNPGDVPLENVVVTDDNATPGLPGDDFMPAPVDEDNNGFNDGDANTDGILDLDEEWLYTAMRTILPGESGQFTNIATVVGTPVGGGPDETDTDPANWFVQTELPPPPPPPVDDFEGLTAGYWKQSQHFDDWVTYDTSDSFDQVFHVNLAGTPTLLDALRSGGGDLNALMRQAVAALLNASSPDINYFYTVQQVLDMTKAAIDSGDAMLIEQTKNLFEAQNELGLDLLASLSPIPV